MPTRVFVDANVFFSRTQRDWLFHIRQATGGGMFTVVTSQDVIAETVYRFRREHPLVDGGVITRLHAAIESLQDEIVDDYAMDIDFPLSDPNDRHVHAAAVAARAHIVLTDDKGWKKLPEDVLDSLPYEASTPDNFFTLAIQADDYVLRRAVEGQLSYWLKRNPDGVDLAPPLRAAGCAGFADHVQAHLTARAMRPG